MWYLFCTLLKLIKWIFYRSKEFLHTIKSLKFYLKPIFENIILIYQDIVTNSNISESMYKQDIQST